MAYSIRFKRRARTELDECCETYCEAFRNNIWDWLRNIATAAENNDTFHSIDVVELLDEAMEHDEQQWRYALRRWFSAKLSDKIKASKAESVISDFVQQLSPTEFTVFDLRCLQGHEAKQIANATGLSTATVYRHLSSVRNRFEAFVREG